MSRHVMIRLTKAEAKALQWAAGNILDACDDREIASFYCGYRRQAAAGKRAFHKLKSALIARGKESK